MAKMTRNTGNTLATPPANFFMSGIRERWRVACNGLSSTRISAGRTVTQPITPKITPFAMTRPRSRPSVKVMKHSAAKPATVVTELPMTEVSVSWMAHAMASLLSACFSRCSL